MPSRTRPRRVTIARRPRPQKGVVVRNEIDRRFCFGRHYCGARPRRVTIHRRCGSRDGHYEDSRTRSAYWRNWNARLYPPGEAELPRRALRHLELVSSTDSEWPESVDLLSGSRVPTPAVPDTVEHGYYLAGPHNRGFFTRDEDWPPDCCPVWCPGWEAEKLLFRCGLVGFPLSVQLGYQLWHLANESDVPILVAIARLRLDRLGARLVARATTLAMLKILAAIAGELPRTGRDADDPPPLPMPRAPGVDPFGLYCPLC